MELVFRGDTIVEQLSKSNNRPSGFDYLRILLSISVVLWHSFETSYGTEFNAGAWASPWRFLIAFILPSFFCLSGFLVAGSMVRTKDLTVFIVLRGIRIFPALIVEVILSAILIGPVFTILPFYEYFHSRQFFAYFFNVIGYIHFNLPGVFVNNPAKTVNAQLWTIPYELECYIVIAIAWLAGLITRRIIYLITLCGLVCFIHIWLFLRGHLPHEFDLAPGRALVLSFLVGVVLFLYRDYVRVNIILFLLSIIGYFIVLLRPETIYLLPLPVGYITIYLGLLNPKRNIILDSGDYSYGIYLYGYPIQQVVSQLFSQYRFWYVNFALTIILSGIVAWCSWTFVESRVLSRKARIIGYVKTIVDHIATVGAPVFRSFGRQ